MSQNLKVILCQEISDSSLYAASVTHSQEKAANIIVNLGGTLWFFEELEQKCLFCYLLQCFVTFWAAVIGTRNEIPGLSTLLEMLSHEDQEFDLVSFLSLKSMDYNFPSLILYQTVILCFKTLA